MSVMQSNFTGLGRSAWLPMPTAMAGFELRTKDGFVFGLQGGVAVPISPGVGNGSTEAIAIPAANLSIGYAFDL